MSYYTQRHGLRKQVERTSDITIERYGVLLDCCRHYFENIAWKYPMKCPDGNGCCGLDEERLNENLKFEIPTLFKNQRGVIDIPQLQYNFSFCAR